MCAITKRLMSKSFLLLQNSTHEQQISTPEANLMLYNELRKQKKLLKQFCVKIMKITNKNAVAIHTRGEIRRAVSEIKYKTVPLLNQATSYSLLQRSKYAH